MQTRDPSTHRKTADQPSRVAGSRRKTLVRILAGLIVGCAFLAGIIGLSAALVPATVIPDAPSRLKLQNDVRATLLQSVGGLLLIVGAYFTWRQLQLGRDQLRQTLDTSNAQLQVNLQTQTTEQLSRSIEQLGHDKAGVRVGAIYALEQIAKNSVDARSGIHELLAAYIRAESGWSHHDPDTLVAIEPAPSPADPPELPLLKVRAPDVQAALTTLGRRLETPDEVVELQSTDLRASYLGSLNLSRCNMGRAILALADLTDANLSDAWLRRTNFHQAILTRCNLQRAVLRDANLREANLADADLRGADMTNADLSQANLQDARCDDTTIWPSGFDWQAAGTTVRPACDAPPSDTP